ncbi:MAG: hypothetical protein LUQ40_02105 [Methanomicrobiales archaeon]|nr:hypothetical protein [Methanomicrobiales archaeon]
MMVEDLMTRAFMHPEIRQRIENIVREALREYAEENDQTIEEVIARAAKAVALLMVNVCVIQTGIAA